MASNELLIRREAEARLALHTARGTLGSGRSFRDNLTDAMSVVPLKKTGSLDRVKSQKIHFIPRS